jgi:hypothetical protein
VRLRSAGPPDPAPPTIAGMNPRYRRLVIPCALVGLILVVVVTAILK